jgi:hypothetical protein
MSAICDFYDGYCTDVDGRFLFQIQDEDDDWLEFDHAWVQWLFPLKEPSNFNPDAPLLTEEDIALFKAKLALQTNLIDSFLRFLKFLGLAWDHGNVIKGENFESRRLYCWDRVNHNWLRITRCLTCLRLLGLDSYARKLYDCLKHLHENENLVSENSFEYWRKAMI